MYNALFSHKVTKIGKYNKSKIRYKVADAGMVAAERLAVQRRAV